MSRNFEKTFTAAASTSSKSFQDSTEDSEVLEDFPFIDPDDCKIIAFSPPPGEGKPNVHCMGCWIRTNFSFKYHNGHSKNKVCFYCLDTWAIRQAPTP